MKLAELQANIKELKTAGLPEEAIFAYMDKVLEFDLPLFCQVILPHLFYKPLGKIHYEFFEMLISSDEKKVLAYPRRHGKTTLEKGFILWSIVYKKVDYMIWLGQTIKMIQMHLANIRRELESNQLLRMVYGDLTTGASTLNEGELFLTNKFHLIVKSTMQSFRGLLDVRRPQYLLVDDLDDDELVESKLQRDKIDNWFFNSVLPSLDEEGRIRVIGTCIHEDCQLMRLVANPAWEAIVYSAILEEGTENERALCEEIYPLAKLKSRKLELFGAKPTPKVQTWWQEYMNMPSNPDMVSWNIDNLKYWVGKYEDHCLIFDNGDKVPCRVYTGVDLASAKATSSNPDFSTVVTAAIIPNGKIYLLAIWRKQRAQPSEIVTKIFEHFKLYKTAEVIIETVACQDYLMETYDKESLKHPTSPILHEVKNRKGGGSKEDRIAGALQNRIRLQQIFIRDGMTDLVEELTGFPRGAHDDLIDALADIAKEGLPPMELETEKVRSTLPPELQSDSNWFEKKPDGHIRKTFNW